MPGVGAGRDKRDDERGGERRPACEETARGGRCRLALRLGLRLRRDADLQRIGPDRLGHVLELGRAQIGDGKIKPALDLSIGVLGETDRPGRGDPLEPGGDIDPVTHQIAVRLLDDVTEMNADAKIDAFVRGHARVALDHGVLHFDSAAHRVDHAAELDDVPVASALDDPSVVDGDRRIDQVATQRPEPRQNAILVRSREPAVADNIGDQDRREFPGLSHCALGRRSD